MGSQRKGASGMTAQGVRGSRHRRRLVARRLPAGLLLAAAVAIAAPAAPASSGACPGGVSADSLAGSGYKYCGRFWRLSDLPVKFQLNLAGALPSAGEFTASAANATAEWNAGAAWSGTGSRPGSCPSSARVACVSGTTSAVKVASDGLNTISWVSGPLSPLGGCTSKPILGMAYVTASGSRITDVDIQLNGNCTGAGGTGSWFGPSTDRTLWGDLAGSTGGMCPSGFEAEMCPAKWDLWGLVAHEMGHALGLGDLNPNVPGIDGCFGGDLWDVPDYQEVMYGCNYVGSTIKRQLRPGDVAGLNRMLWDAASA